MHNELLAFSGLLTPLPLHAMRARVAQCPNRPLPDRPGLQRQAQPGQQKRLENTAQLPRSLRAAQCRAYRVDLPGVSQALKSFDEDDLAVPTAHAEDYWLPPGELSQIDRNGGMGDHDVFRCFGCTRTECQAWPLHAARGLQLYAQPTASWLCTTVLEQ